MDANYIYDVMDTAARRGLEPRRALRLVEGRRPLEEGKARRVGAFVEANSADLLHAFRSSNRAARALFAEAVAACAQHDDG